jgi:hypothetical protein
MMTDEQIVELAEQHFDYQGGWIADTKDLLKFSRALYAEGFKVGIEYGYDEGWESSNVNTEMNTWSDL